MKIIYCDFDAKIGLCIFYPDDIYLKEDVPKSCVDIDEKTFQYLLDGRNNGKLTYLDKNNKFQLRDQFTKYDNAIGTWIIDQDAVDKDKHQQLINSAINYYNAGLKYGSGYLWNKLTVDQQKELTTYLDALDDIVEGKNTISTELPTKLEFIK